MTDTKLAVLQPPQWPRPKGYANGMMGDGRLVVLAGQIGWDEAGVFPPGFVAQTAQALRNILTVLAEAGGTAENIARLTWYVTDIAAYREQARELGPVWREVMGRNYPTMSVIGVSALVEPEAMVEIEAIAIL